MNLKVLEKDSLLRMTKAFMRRKQPAAGMACIDNMNVKDTLDMMNAPLGRRLVDADRLDGFNVTDQD